MAAPPAGQLNNSGGRHADRARRTIRPVPVLDNPHSVADGETVGRRRTTEAGHERNRCDSCDDYDDKRPRHCSLLGLW